MSSIRDFWKFMKERKKFWLAPVIVVLVVLGFLLITASNSAAGVFVYTLF
tara:strand:+ start:404 stop:553 length:150 start_codon:yes stop_codon:yes gene_type:complete